MTTTKFEKLHKELIDRLKELEIKHKDLFLNDNIDKLDSLQDHYVLIVRADSNVSFSFKPESQLPDFFKKLCKNEYERIFLNKLRSS